MEEFYSTWISCQMGAREHYAIPKVLFDQGNLSYFITDFWVKPQSILKYLPKSLFPHLRQRFAQELTSASVFQFNRSLIAFELKHKIKRTSGWELIILRNQWFQEQSLKALEDIAANSTSPITVFAYSYAALKIFRFAKKQGWQTVLGQIDAGKYDEQLIGEEHQRYPISGNNWQAAPQEYWENWQQECQLADQIIVNSKWSSEALQIAGVPENKLKIIPLAYNSQNKVNDFTRTYPPVFSEKRPLRVLFLGRILLRKGVIKIFEAIELLQNEPIEFWFVGSVGMKIPEKILTNPKFKYFGSVSRNMTAKYYRDADVFLFPTLSDGFGLTQLEAQAWQLPIIASKFCGTVVKDNVDGFILKTLTGQEIATYLRHCLNNPALLAEFANRQSQNIDNFSLSELGKNLKSINQPTTV